MASALKAHGHRVWAASGESEAWARLSATPVDLIILETSLSDAADGYQFCRKIKRNAATCTIPVIFIGDADDASSQVHAFSAGGADYVVLPLNIANVLARVNHYLAIVAARNNGWVSQSRPASLGEPVNPADGADSVGTHQPSQKSLELEGQAAWLQRKLGFSDILEDVIDALQDPVEEIAVLQTVVDILGKGLGLRYGNATLHAVDTLTDELTVACQYILKETDSSVDAPVDFRAAPTIQAVSRLLSDHRSIQFCYRHPDWGWQLVLACPIADNHALLGDLWLCWPATPSPAVAHPAIDYLERMRSDGGDLGDKARFSCELVPQAIALAQRTADQCAIAIRRAQFAQKVRDQAEILESLRQQKDDFLSAVSHELCSPVTNMKMAIQMLSMSIARLQHSGSGHGTVVADSVAVMADPATDKMQQYLNILTSECDREISLINDLLDLQRLDADIQSSNVGLIPIESWLTSIVHSFEERLQHQQRTLQFRCLTSPLTSFRTDVTAVHRILTELLDNACKYTPLGETVLVTARMVERALQLQVTNSGVEIPASHLPYVFDKFYRVQSNNLWQKEGTGLGLALVKRLTNYLGGTIQVSSQQGKTSFRLMIPEMNPVN
ncbi:MAG: ATP-binding protein [Elainellaceae cyanobacterium]